MAELTLEEAREVYKKSDSLKSLMLTKFSKEELETQEVSQEEFDKTFLELLGKCTKTVFLDAHGNECIVPSNRIDLRNDSGEWMFDIQFAGKNTCFLVSYFRVWKIFYDKYLLQDKDIQRFMKNQMNILFGLDDVKPYDSGLFGPDEMNIQFGLDDITAVPPFISFGIR